MQIVYKNEDKKDSSQRANSVGIIVCVGRIGKYLEREHIERFGGGLLEYKTVGKSLVEIKKEFGGEEEESVKVAELRRLE